ncbi:MAG: cobyrinic acid a,c-diamide synthase [Candidatus Dactylopiibacterium carminicum]|uniref:Cobyrinate a,c-diamide synthase n=1 Tax=Candidatus Dactylopiibacterium carminicum TaxID=857335 RepID=A0A272EYR7_9RHOO|nr:cobyrinate a,c-diamide synthase [Candidatus Dactylopiibacterium carminicum]KAF7600779.1 cobyrinate a,c-diamide synthase [Candidatus Dactylopiibacterium carminicum]PAS95278.1 MAG: cobyrinic acid a,c-diamide synthase [Candidatus Dactylopiibacterium carminicum]PAS98710.1 MAG: cobyrinic acid a,c-diamide synthase [Candidatus Dactylopiibacterium carminicum]PAT00786.1 MAG: cobyrinic acid a,c-diamide synthase [Candidatus Dactylopiibacterium carminicum]
MSCRAFLVTAPASGQGKTTVTAALARQARARGERVRVFKTGPDFFDPMIHEVASGESCHQLDLFMGGLAHCQALLAEAAREANLILVEGVMGLFDGKPSSADLTRAFRLPIVAVIDGSAMAQTFGALAHGLASFQPDLEFAGVIANRVASERHAAMLFESLPPQIPGLGWLPREAAITLPERHLGLLPAAELADLESRLDKAATALHFDASQLLDWEGPGDVAQAVGRASARYERPDVGLKPDPRLSALQGQRIAIARDEAFCFIYPANLDTLRALGAELAFFSPLHDATLPACDAVWLPGGYPELHAARIAANEGMQLALLAHASAGKPLLAECDGMMSLFETLVTADGAMHAGFGLLEGGALMQGKLAALGLQEAALPEGSLRGHSFHYSRADTPLVPIAHGTNPNGGATTEAVYRVGRSTASYIHFYFPSNPAAVAALFRA